MDKDQNLQYNYVICGSDNYYDFGYRDIMNLPYVKYYHSYVEGIVSKWMKKIVRLNFSHKVNKFIKTPFASIVYPKIYKPVFNDDKPLCFIFFGNVEYVYQTSYLSYLRSTYPNIKLVLYMQDLICKNSKLNFEACRNSFDLILSYDKGDCSKYNLYYNPTPMSYVNIVQDTKLEASDIYFCGYAKNRYPLIHELFKKYVRMGLKCDFHIMKFPENEEKVDGIYYDDHNFTYEQNIQHVLNTKSILEIMQDGAVGYTPRVWESIIYDKHLLTNNYSVFKSEFFHSTYMHDIYDSNLISLIEKPVLYDVITKNKLSPIHLLKHIDVLLAQL